MTVDGDEAREASATQASPPGPGRPSAEGQTLAVVPVAIQQATIDFTVRLGGAGAAFFSLGVRKSGSTMLNKVVNFLANQNAINIVNIPGGFFRNGFIVADWATLDLSDVLAPANLYSGFRTFPAALATTELYRDGLKVFMFRDPRDALISQYFSDAYSHQLPKTGAAGGGRELFLKKREEAQKADIDEWVLKRAGSFRRTLLGYRETLEDPNCLTLRYENYVFQKRRMISKILAHFGWTIERGAITRLLTEIDVMPATEEKTNFIRKVIPGDHIAKLHPETIEKLNEEFSDVLAIYDYY